MGRAENSEEKYAGSAEEEHPETGSIE